jgi:hypothetical protein
MAKAQTEKDVKTPSRLFAEPNHAVNGRGYLPQNAERRLKPPDKNDE